MKVVVDPNVIISSFQNPHGNPNKIIDMWKNGKIILCMSEEIVFEYIEVLNRLNIPKRKTRELTELFKLREYVNFSTNVIHVDAVKDDPQDNKFIECAVVTNAQYIISGDRHLRALQKYGGIKIVSPSEFLEL
ncbi:MAG: putative toxin-antitoxin system toxin component, PIN family [Nitrospirae bacterium]|nr:putative toxin-antitoxin system toxin component, PIN family [Nitrospirota bacterium]